MPLGSQMVTMKQGELLVISPGSPLWCHEVWIIRYLEVVAGKAMAPHSSTLAWRIPWMEEPGRLQSMGSRRVGQDFTFTFHFHALEEEMATHSSVLAWRIPGTGEPDRLPSYGVAQSQTRLK